MEFSIEREAVEDAPEILALQKAAFRSEAEFYGDFSIEPPVQTGGRIRFSGESMSRMPVGNPRRSETLRVLHDGAARVFLGWVGIIPNGKPYRHPGVHVHFLPKNTPKSRYLYMQSTSRKPASSTQWSWSPSLASRSMFRRSIAATISSGASPLARMDSSQRRR